MKVLIAGGSGFIGRSLIDRLVQAGHTAVILTRRPAMTDIPPNPSIRSLHWDARSVGEWWQVVNDTDAIINLAGEAIAAKRWTVAQKDRISTSRIDATRTVVRAIEKATRKPKVLISASGIGYYGDVREGDLDESSPHGDDFFARLSLQWESEALRAEKHAVRVVTLRTGIVLHPGGGAMKKFHLPFKFFVGGPLGPGTQWMSWIHREDAIRAMLFALENESLSGPLNITAPYPVTMREFCRTLGSALRRPSWIPVPGFALRLVLGEMADVVLKGQRAVPRRLLQAGFSFKFPQLEQAMSDLMS